MRRLSLPRRNFSSDDSAHRENIRVLESWANFVRLTVTPYFHGAGKVNAQDSDFPFKPENGMHAVVRDDTTGDTWLSVRSNGNWRHVQLT